MGQNAYGALHTACMDHLTMRTHQQVRECQDCHQVQRHAGHLLPRQSIGQQHERGRKNKVQRQLRVLEPEARCLEV